MRQIVFSGLAHDVVEDEADNDQAGEHEHQQGEDEEGGLGAIFCCRLGDAESVDEGVGEKVEEPHELIMRVGCGESWGVGFASE